VLAEQEGSLLAGGALVEAAKSAADFDSKTQALANNTNMGTKGL
jgi:hypothetical protein